MALIKCPECGREISDKAVTCPNCGCPIDSRPKNEEKQIYVNGVEQKRPQQTMPNQNSNIVVHNSTPDKKRGCCLTVTLVVVGFFFIIGMVGSLATGNKSSEKTENTWQETEVEKEKNDQKEMDGHKNSEVIYYMDLYENYENYIGKYVTISAPLNYADGEDISIKGDIEGFTGMISVTLTDSEQNLKEGDFVTLTARVDSKAAGYLYLEDAVILEVGDSASKIYSQQKDEYDMISAQKSAEEVEEYKISCESLNYESILRNPDDYDGKNCVVSGKVDQIIEGWLGSYTIFISDSSGKKWGCVYSYEEGESHLLEGDSVTVYGECKGTENTKTVLGKQVTLPRIDIKYIN